MVESPKEYAWSSYWGYIGKAKKEDWVEYSWVLSQFDRDWKRAAKKYKEYVAQAVLGLCIFRTKPSTHSDPNRPLNPIENVHSFRSKSSTYSEANRPL